LSAAPNGVVHADDFIPHTDMLTQVCVWGTYLDASAPGVPTFTGAEQYDCTGMVEDNFRVRVYDDDGGRPGTLIAESSIPEWGEVYRRALRGSGFESLYGIEMQAYTLLLDPPIYLEVGVTHWLEVANDTSDPEGNTCNWHWAVADDVGNGDSAGGTGDGYIAGSGQSVDLAFCLGGPGGSPLDFTVPAPTGSCCDCTFTCTDDVTFVDCQEDFDGIWHRGWDCSNPLACFNEGDDCEIYRIPITDGIYPFDTTCATTDGPEIVIGEQGLFAFGKDIWFEYTATSTGWLLASLCASGIQYDAAIAVYHDFENPAQCACPCTSSAYQVNPASNEGCNGITDGGAGIIKDIIVFAGECWLIRVGGTGPTAEAADSGRGILEVLCEAEAPSCFQSSTPQPERLSLPGDPISQKVRYLSFSAGNSGRNQAIRVKLTNLPAPFDYLNGQDMWVGEPRDISESPLIGEWHPSPPPPLYKGANLQCTPYFRDWSKLGVIYVFDDEIVPSATYTIQVIDDTCELANEADYSAALTLTTSAWGDVVSNCVTNPCGPPDGSAGMTDLTAILDKFMGLPGAPIKARADLYPAIPNGIVNFDDIVAVLDAYLGASYPPSFFALPSPCPGSFNGSPSGSARWTNPGLEPADWQGALKHRRRPGAMSKNISEATGPGPQISLVPISASGSYQINGNEIVLEGGNQTVSLELYVSNWDEDLDIGMCCENAADPWTCDWDSSCSVSSQDCGGGLTCVYHPQLRVIQAQIASAGYSSGQSGTLTPTGAFQNTGHSDWIFAGVANCTKGVSTASLDYAWGGTAWLPGAVPDFFWTKYFGTLELYVPVGAAGTFTIDFYPHDHATYVNDISGWLRIPGLTTTPALITVLAELQPPGPEDSGYGTCVDYRDCPNMPCAGGKCYITKNRYISFVPGNPGKQTALRVTLFQLPEEFDEFTGLKMWVDQPQAISENGGKIVHTPGWPDFMGAYLECPPDRHCMDWSTAGVLHVTDDEILPDAVYHVQAIDCADDPQDEGNYTAPLVIPTGKWGDICGAFVDGQWWPPDGSVDIVKDVTAVLDKFRNLEGVLIKARTDLEPNLPDWLVNISDTTYVLDAFRGFAYPPAQTPQPPRWTGPIGCP